MSRNKNFDEATVLQNAVNLFRRKGYQATTPAELVNFLGISRSSLYGTYGDKRSLFIKSLNLYRDSTTEALKAIANNSDDIEKTIKSIFNLTIDGCFEELMPKGCFLVNSVAELPSHEVELVAIVNESRAEHRKVFIDLIKKGQKKGQLSTSLKPHSLADYMVNCLSGISITAKGGASKKTCQDIAKNSLLVFEK